MTRASLYKVIVLNLSLIDPPLGLSATVTIYATMMLLTAFSLLLPISPVFALPWLMPGAIGELLKRPNVREKIRQQLSGRSAPMQTREINGVWDPVLGLIPTDSDVEGLMRFPEAAYPFQTPGPTDQRGPCPGLNTLANHGYIPRTGIATMSQIFNATAHVFNMEFDTTAVLVVGAVLQGGDIVTTRLSIGGPDSRVGILGGALTAVLGTPSGIAGHGKWIEGDASITRNDFFLDGDDSTFQPVLFQQLHQCALELGNGTYIFPVMLEHFKRRYADSKANNKQFYFNAPSGLAVMGAYYFVPAFFSNGSYIDGSGIPNEASITSFYGAQPTRPGAASDPNLTYTRVPERIPPGGWYRRRTPMTDLETVAGILAVYLDARPQLGGNDANGAFVAGPIMLPTTPQGLSCFFYNAIYANFPSEAFNIIGLAETVVNFLTSWLKPGYEALSCDVQAPITSAAYDTWSETYVGNAKEGAVGSAWYRK